MSDYNYDYTEYTNIYKFNFLDSGEIKYSCKNKVAGAASSTVC